MSPGHGVSLVAFGGASQNSVINLLTGAVGVHAVNNAPFTIDPGIGPSLVGGNNDREFTFPNQVSTVTETVYTQAALVTITSLATSGVVGSPGNNSSAPLRCAAGVFSLGAPLAANGPNAILNTPCFILASFNGAVLYWAMTNLRTGAVTTSSINAAGSIPPNGTAVFLTASSQPLNEISGNLAAYMWAPNFLSPTQLLAWAADPFAFWYPSQQQRSFKGSAPTAFTISIGSVPYTLTDEQLKLLKTSKENVQAGTYALTDEALITKKGSLAKAQSGSYLLTGEQITALKKSVDNLQSGTYNTSSQEVLKKTSLLNVQETPYALTDESLATKKGYADFPQAGNYTLTGEQQVQKKTSILNAQETAFALTDEALALKATRLDKAQAGFYSLTDEQLALKAGKLANPQSGSYALTGEFEGLKATRLLNAQMTPYTLTGENLTLTIPVSAATVVTNFAFLFGMGPFAGNAFAQNPVNITTTTFKMFVGSGVYSLAGEQLTLIKKSKMGVQAGVYTLTDEQLQLLKGSLLKDTTGTYALTDEQLTLTAARLTKAQSALYSLTDENLRLLKTSLAHLQTGFYSLTGESLTIATAFPGQFSISIGTGVYSLTDENLTLLKKSTDGLQVVTYSLAGEPLQALKASRLTNTTGTYTLTGEALKLTAARLMSPQAGFYNFTSALTITRRRFLNTATGFYTVTGNGLTIQHVTNPLNARSRPNLLGSESVTTLLGTKNAGINLLGGGSLFGMGNI